jgi:hypothetical protein
MIGGAAVVGGLFYVAHRVKQVVVEKAAENGVDLSGRRSEASAKRALPKACDVLTKDDVASLIGEPIERAEPKDEMCLYFGPAGLSAKLAQSKMSDSLKRAQAPGAQPDGMDVATSVDQMVNNLGVQNGQTEGGEQPLLMIGLDADGGAQMAAVSASKAIFSSLGRSAADPNQKGLSFGADIAGLGDKAIRIPKLGLNVLQRGVLIRIIPGPFPDSDAKTIAVARAVLPKL